jgi:hypothetical protein
LFLSSVLYELKSTLPNSLGPSLEASNRLTSMLDPCWLDQPHFGRSVEARTARQVTKQASEDEVSLFYAADVSILVPLPWD